MPVVNWTQDFYNDNSESGIVDDMECTERCYKEAIRASINYQWNGRASNDFVRRFKGNQGMHLLHQIHLGGTEGAPSHQGLSILHFTLLLGDGNMKNQPRRNIKPLTKEAFEALLKKASQPVKKGTHESDRAPEGTSESQNHGGCIGKRKRPNRTEGA